MLTPCESHWDDSGGPCYIDGLEVISQEWVDGRRKIKQDIHIQHHKNILEKNIHNYYMTENDDMWSFLLVIFLNSVLQVQRLEVA